MKISKRFTMMLLFIVAIGLFTSIVYAVPGPVNDLLPVIQDVPAEQGPSNLKEWIAVIFTWKTIGYMIAGLFAIVIAAAGAKYQKLLVAIQEAIKAFTEAKDEDSPGGKAVTKEEKKLIFNEALDVLKEVFNVFSGGLVGTIGKGVIWITKLFKK